MSRDQHQEGREEQAWKEVGVTRVSRGVAWFLVLGFLLPLAAVPLWQLWQEQREVLERAGEREWPQVLDLRQAVPAAAQAWRDGEDRTRGRRWLDANQQLLREIGRFEDALEDESIFGQLVRPPVQRILLWGGVGNEDVYPGRDGWLFYRPGVDSITGLPFLDERHLRRRSFHIGADGHPVQPDPRRGILHFHKQLQARGIQLVLVPTPVKPTIQPERMSARAEQGMILRNPSFEKWRRSMEEAGVAVFDPAPVLLDFREETGMDPFLRDDTHWRPEAMERVAGHLADWLRKEADVPERTGRFAQRELAHQGVGDVLRMLQLPGEEVETRRQTVTLRQVLRPDGGFWRSDPDASLLVLGDSFSNLYSVEAMGWGESAGLIEHLSLALGMPVDRITRNDAGAYATRDILARELRRGRDRLEGKRWIVYQFAERELALGNWKEIDLRLGEPVEGEFLRLDGDQVLEVEGTVASVSPVPRPGTVPYADHILSIHLVDLSDEARIPDAEAVVYLFSMRNNELTAAARLRSGDRIRIRLQAWEALAPRYEAINRSEPEDFELQLVEPLWGTLVR